MTTPMPAKDVLSREYLEIRAKILELAASFDRLDRGGKVFNDPRIELIQKALATLNFETTERAEKVQMIFSREYESKWREKYQLT